MAERYHVYPLNDIRPHNTDGLDCWCHPEFDEDDNVVIHNAADGGEAFETGERRPS